jgi:acetate kinase
MKILVLNSGSSSEKACLYDMDEAVQDHSSVPLWKGRIEWSRNSAVIAVKNSQGVTFKEQLPVGSRQEGIRHLLLTVYQGEAPGIRSISEVDAVGHRVVHGGPYFDRPVVITDEVRAKIASMSAFAPLHIPGEVEGMEIVKDLLGAVPQVAVFDTGFHRQMPRAAAVYAGPYEWFESGIRRYGFHGINHQYCVERAAQMLGVDAKALKIVSCHLGNGCSITAIHEGRSVDTTMGFTPVDGLMMGTRSGSVDPGILTYLMRQDHVTAQQLDDVLNRESGLLGISGVSGDMRDILSCMRQGHERAKLAFDIYVHRLRAAIGSMAAVLGGMDVLVFTAGVGENSPQVRGAACSGLEFLGLCLCDRKNTQPCLDQDISASDSRVRVLVIHAEEDWAIAKECCRVLQPPEAQNLPLRDAAMMLPMNATHQANSDSRW